MHAVNSNHVRLPLQAHPNYTKRTSQHTIILSALAQSFLRLQQTSREAGRDASAGVATCSTVDAWQTHRYLKRNVWHKATGRIFARLSCSWWWCLFYMGAHSARVINVQLLRNALHFDRRQQHGLRIPVKRVPKKRMHGDQKGHRAGGALVTK